MPPVNYPKDEEDLDNTEDEDFKGSQIDETSDDEL
jgi:hypothetical protein